MDLISGENQSFSPLPPPQKLPDYAHLGKITHHFLKAGAAKAASTRDCFPSASSSSFRWLVGNDTWIPNVAKFWRDKDKLPDVPFF